MSIKLGRLTNGERLLINRRRHLENQRPAAFYWGVSTTLYSRWERDVVRGPRIRGRMFLQPYERCLLTRRRHGHTQQGVADDMGICKMTVTKMERGVIPCDRLLKYWE